MSKKYNLDWKECVTVKYFGKKHAWSRAKRTSL